MKLLNAKTILGNLMVAACLVSPGARGLSVDNNKKQTPEDASGAATIIKKLPEDLVPVVAIESQGALRGSSSSRSGGAGASVERALSGCSSGGGKKKVTPYRFCIQGDCDAGAEGEHRLQLDGHWLWNGFRDFREGQCHNLWESPRVVDAWKSLVVGTEEHDTTSGNDSWFATMTASEWYLDTCETYEVILAVEHSGAVRHTTCFEVSATFKGLGGGATHCSEWTAPAESFIWYLMVEPDHQDDPLGWHDSDGTVFNCNWYSQGDRCSMYGDNFRNFGKTAKEACVVCGGGI